MSTYTFDSDIPFYNKKQCFQNYCNYTALVGTDYAMKKQSNVTVAWFISVCETQSEREKYVEELQKHIKVDIYGACGTFKCGTNQVVNWNNEALKFVWRSTCMERTAVNFIRPLRTAYVMSISLRNCEKLWIWMLFQL